MPAAAPPVPPPKAVAFNEGHKQVPHSHPHNHNNNNHAHDNNDRSGSVNLNGSIENLEGSIGDLNGTLSRRRQREQAELAEIPEPPADQIYYEVKVFYMNKWTRRAALLTFVSSLLTIFVPQVIAFAPDSHTFGLFQECTGMACLPANYSILQQHPGCKAGCNNPTDFRARFGVISAMFWIGAVCSILLGMLQYLHYARKYLIKLEGILLPTVIVSLVGLAVLICGLGVFGTTLDLGYEKSACTYAEGCLVYGSSSYVAVFALIVFFLSGFCAVVSGILHGIRMKNTGAFFGELLKKAPLEQLLAMAAGKTNQNSNDENNNNTHTHNTNTNNSVERKKTIVAAKKREPTQHHHDDDDEELTDLNALAAQPTGQFHGNDNDDDDDDEHPHANVHHAKHESDQDDDTDPTAERAALLVASASRHYASKHDGDNGSEDDDDAEVDESGNKKTREGAQLTEEEKKAAVLREKNNSLRSWQRTFNLGGVFFAILATGFCMGAVLSPKWVSLSSTPKSSALDRYSIGVFIQCKDVTCSKLSYADLLINNTCGNTATLLEGRLAISGLFYALTAILSAPLFFSASPIGECCSDTLARKILTCSVFVASLLGILLLMHTFDAWINCDVPWCEAYLSTHKTTGNCEYGFTFGVALLTVCISTTLVTMNIIQYCCRPCGYEDKEATEELRLRLKEKRDRYTEKNLRSSSPNVTTLESTNDHSGSNINISSSAIEHGNEDQHDEDDDDEGQAPPQVHSTPKHNTYG